MVHGLCRSAVRNFREAGVPESVIMQITGHRARSVFDRYGIVATENLQRAMRRVQAVAQVVEVPRLSEKFDSSWGFWPRRIFYNSFKINAKPA